MKCSRCQNTDPKLFQYDQGVYYCRKCIKFSRLNVGETVKIPKLSHRIWDGKPILKYKLTDAQLKVSNAVAKHLQEENDVFLYAATGAGKTECTFEAICLYLAQGKKVAFAISRRQVVLEIATRLRRAFPELSIIEVAQGYTTITDADIIVCTMHQLYRYPYSFDLLILDEIDAFPYAGNDVLHAIVDQACIGQKLLLSATPDEEHLKLIEKGKIKQVCLFERPHKHPLIVPKVIKISLSIQIVIIIGLCIRFKHERKQVLLFVPKKSDSAWLKLVLSCFINCKAVHSSTSDKDLIIEAFRNKKYDCLVCTTLLERGITIPSVQVIVYHADHTVFTTASLIQIFGRIGRSFDDPDGKGYCLCRSYTRSIGSCIKQLKWMNDTAYAATKN